MNKPRHRKFKYIAEGHRAHQLKSWVCLILELLKLITTNYFSLSVSSV